MKKVIVIAEVGVNHNGNLSLAKKLIKKSKSAGADYVKFQFYSSEKLAKYDAIKAKYQIRRKKKETQFEMLKKYELSLSQIKELITYSKKIKINFMGSVFDLDSLKLFKKLKLNVLKIPSGELNNFELIEEVAKLKKDIILSTGMSTFNEIKKTFDYLTKRKNNKSVTVLHCVSSYPTRPENVYIKNLLKLSKLLNTKVGFSDHTKGYVSSICALCMGANVIEKHITLNQNMDGPDHKSSLNPVKFKKFVDKLRETETILKSVNKKKFSKDELENSKVVKKSIVAKTFIRKGQKFSKSNITTKRPYRGISASKWFDVLGKTAKKNYIVDEFIKS